MAKKILSRADIIGAKDIRTDEIHVPEWGGIVLVRGLTGAERTEYEKSCLVKVGKGHDVNLRQLRTKLVARAAVDEAGKRIFADSDAEELDKKSAAAIDRVFKKAQELSGIGDEELEALEADLEQARPSDSISG